MSMSLNVYVGPYLRCTGLPGGLLDEYETTVCDGRSELLHDDDGVKYVVPNCEVPGIYRKTLFSDNNEIPVTPITPCCRGSEISEFAAIAQPFIIAAHDSGADVAILWGVVCDYS